MTHEIANQTTSGIGKLDAETIRSLGYRIVDMIVDDVTASPQRPILPPPQTSEGMEELFGGPVPSGEMTPAALLDVIQEKLLPVSGNINHPNLMGYVVSTPLPLAGMVDALISCLKLIPGAWFGMPGSTHIEVVVARWLGEMVGYSNQAAGYITTGGTMANLFGLAAARVHCAGWDVRAEGLSGHSQLVIYCSVEVHTCVDKSVELLGLGSNNLRKIPVDAEYRIRLDLLEEAIEADMEAGKKPLCVVGNAGTVNTGAVDPLAALADIAEKYDCWFHIDGAYGAFGAMVEEAKPLFHGMERADSLVLDPHKWLNVPLEAGCILVKNWSDLSDTFSTLPAYLRAVDEAEATGHNHLHYGFELSRTDRALKIWLSLQQYGVTRYKQMIAGHMAQVQALAEWVKQSENFELVSEPSLSITCFRYLPADLRENQNEHLAYLNELNQALEFALAIEGDIMVSGTDLQQKRVLRVCVVSYQVTPTVVEELFHQLQIRGRSLDQQMRETA